MNTNRDESGMQRRFENVLYNAVVTAIAMVVVGGIMSIFEGTLVATIGNGILILGGTGLMLMIPIVLFTVGLGPKSNSK